MKKALRILSTISIVLFIVLFLVFGVIALVSGIGLTHEGKTPEELASLQTLALGFGAACIYAGAAFALSIVTLSLSDGKSPRGAMVAFGVLDILFGVLVPGILLLCYKKEHALVREQNVSVKKTPFEMVVFIIAFIFFAAYSALLFYPLIWGLIGSLKGMKDFNENPFSLPSVWQLGNYIKAVKTITADGMSFPQMMWNSIWFAGGSCLICMEFTSFYAYVLNKYNFKGKKFLYSLCLFMIAVPISASFVSTYRLMNNLHLTNSPLILLTATNVYGMNLIMCYTYYNNISSAYVEAAKIDGAGFYSTYFKAMRPQAMPIMITLALLMFIGKWNDYMSPLLYLSNMPTLATGLYRYQSIVEWSGDYPVLFAGIFICTLPLFVVFFFFSDRLMQNINIGGLKG